MVMHFRRSIGLTVGLTLAALVAAASSSCNSSSNVGLDQSCSINSNCHSPLVCAFARCHDQCTASRDCPTGERCLLSGTTGVCQLPAESTCASASATCQSGQVCGTDQQCRTQCSSTIACVTGDYCVPSGGISTCYAASNSSDEVTLVGDGILSADGSVLDGSTLTSDANAGASNDGSAASTGDATMGTSDGGPATSTGSDSSTKSDAPGIAVNSCPNAQTQFGNTAQGDSNPNFTSGVGVRTATQLLIFSGYVGPADAGDGGAGNLVYVQAFNPTTATSLGPAQPLFAAPDGVNLTLDSASVASTGQIALAFSYGGTRYSYGGAGNQGPVYAAFLAPSSDAGPAGLALENTPVEIESATTYGQPHVIWSVATGAFVYSWEYESGSTWFLGSKSFLANGQAAGGTDPIPTDVAAAALNSGNLEQGSVAAGPNWLGVAFVSGVNDESYLTILDSSGNQVGSALPISATTGSAWGTVAATAQGFVYLYDTGSAVAEAFVPTSGDAGVVLPDAGDAGLSGFTFTGAIRAIDAHAISDDTGGAGGIGAALLYPNGLSFAYVNADGATHVGPLSVISHTYAVGDQFNITNFGGSFGVSLYSAASQSTQMAASGCQ
jgi:hypothetical protein